EVRARAYVVEQGARKIHRLAPEDGVPDEPLRRRCGQQALKLCPRSSGIQPPPDDRGKARVPVPLPRIALGARGGVAVAHSRALTLAPVAFEGAPAQFGQRPQRATRRMRADRDPGWAAASSGLPVLPVSAAPAPWMPRASAAPSRRSIT